VNYYFITLLTLCALYALWAGGGPERVGASVYASSVVVTDLIRGANAHRWMIVQVGEFTIDAVTFIIFVVIALWANRYWPIWVTALLGLGVLGHLARLAGPDIFWWAYAVSLTIWSYPIVLLFALGAFLHRRRLALHGADSSWVNSSSLSGQVPPAGPTAS
jgi:hypothetical protein